MSRKPPESEQGCDEALSAYLDGELSDEERREVENALENDGRLSARLKTYRSLSGLLRESHVEDPEPDVAFFRELESAYEESRRPVSSRRSSALVGAVWFRALSYAAALCMGILIGASAHNLAKDRKTEDPEKTPTSRSSVMVEVVANTHTISPRQAAELIRENEAENLKSEVLGNVKPSEWVGAWTAGWKLGKEYSDTLDMNDLDDLDRNEIERHIRREVSRSRGM